jgi:hypothetical protein
MQPIADSGSSLAERLERGELLTFTPSPVALAAQHFSLLRSLRPRGSVHKDISYNPARRLATGFRCEAPADADSVRAILCEFAAQAAGWLARLLPRYASSWQPDRVTFRLEEEATRNLRLTARNDLLHFDAFPSRPTGGRRILRLFVNVNLTDPRVWATSATFTQVFERYGKSVGLPVSATDGWLRRWRHGLLNLFQPGAAERTAYDTYMLRLHHFLKHCDEFQERSPRRLWHFPPGSAWLLFTDALSHAELRGQYALECSFFITRDALSLPAESPFALIENACAAAPLPRAA